MPPTTVPPADIGALVMLMSSMPTHSSLLTALVVRTRTCTCAWLSAASGSVTSTAVTCVAVPAVVASATKPLGRLVQLPESPMRYCTAIC